jgi:hypothetical protein
VRAAVLNGRLRARRRSATRMRFSADLLFAKVSHLISVVVGAAGTQKRGPLAVTTRWYQTSGAGTRTTHSPIHQS